MEQSDIEEFALTHGLEYFATSSTLNTNLTEVFEYAVEELFKRLNAGRFNGQVCIPKSIFMKSQEEILSQMIWTPEKEEIEREVGDTTEDGAGSSSATKESTQSSFSSKKRSSELSGSDEPGKKDKEAKHNSRPTSIGPDKSHPKKKDKRASEKVKNGKPGRVNEF